MLTGWLLDVEKSNDEGAELDWSPRNLKGLLFWPLPKAGACVFPWVGGGAGVGVGCGKLCDCPPKDIPFDALAANVFWATFGSIEPNGLPDCCAGCDCANADGFGEAIRPRRLSLAALILSIVSQIAGPERNKFEDTKDDAKYAR